VRSWDDLIIAFRRCQISCGCLEFFVKRLIVEEYPGVLFCHQFRLSAWKMRPTWYFRFHLNSNCCILCIIPSNSEFLTRLIKAARGLLLLVIEKRGRTVFDTAYLLFEFSFSHRIGSGRFLSVNGNVACAGWNADKSWVVDGLES
jgi:hypothetical protein